MLLCSLDSRVALDLHLFLFGRHQILLDFSNPAGDSRRIKFPPGIGITGRKQIGKIFDTDDVLHVFALNVCNNDILVRKKREN